MNWVQECHPEGNNWVFLPLRNNHLLRPTSTVYSNQCNHNHAIGIVYVYFTHFYMYLDVCKYMCDSP